MARLPFFSRAHKAEERSLAWPDNSRPPSWSDFTSGTGGYSPVWVTRESSLGLPAVSAAIRLVSETIAALPLMVYQGFDAQKRVAASTWQYRLLHDLPSGDFTPFDFLSDVAACLESAGNAYMQKVIVDNEVIALLVIDPVRVEIKREDGEKVFYIKKQGRPERHTASEIIHIRGFSVTGSDEGMSPIGAHRSAIGAMDARQQYSARFYGQGMGKKTAIELPEAPDKEEAKMMLETIKANHTGIQNAWVPMMLTNGATIKDVGMSLEDAQFVEAGKLDLVQVANIYRIPPSLLGAEAPSANPEHDSIRFLTFGLMPRLRRIELALRSDPDLFPDRNVYPEFETKALLRPDALTRAQVLHYEIQDGRTLVDEARAEDGKAPLPPMADDWTQEPGKVPQITPVGGAPNPTVSPGDL
jgi:HK97 family phage portal protein